MQLPWIPVLLVGVLLAGCAAQPVTVAVGKSTRKAPAAKASPDAAPSVPAAAAEKILAAPAAAELLQKPTDGVVALTGRVVVDASYLVDLGAGQVISNDGSSVVAAGSGSVISNDGSSIVGKDGTTLVAGKSGNVIANGGGLIGQDGAGLIGQDGAGLVGQDGAGLVGQDGAGFGSGVAMRDFGLLSLRRVLAANRPDTGTTLPAAAMQVSVLSMATGQPISLGMDAKGRPVTAVYTNALGGYEVYVPSSYAGNVRVVAGVPKEAAQRLNIAVIVPARSAELAAIDDDTALISDYTRLCFAARVNDFFTPEVIARTPSEGASFGDLIAAEFIEAATTGPSKALSKDERWALSIRVADAMLAHVDLSVPMTDYALAAEEGPQEGCLAAMVDAMKNMRRDMTKVMLDLERQGIDPEAHFAANPHLQAAAKADGVAYAIKRPADFPDFIVHSQMLRSENDELGRTQRMSEIATSFGLVHTLQRAARIGAAGRGLIIYLMTTCFVENQNAREDGLALLRSGGK